MGQCGLVPPLQRDPGHGSLTIVRAQGLVSPLSKTHSLSLLASKKFYTSTGFR